MPCASGMLWQTGNHSAVNSPALHGVAGPGDTQVCLVEPAGLSQLVPEEFDGHRRGINRRFDQVDHVRYRTDVVFMTVRDHDRANAVGVFGQVVEVGDDHLDARHVVLREEYAGVDDDDVLAHLEDHHVLANLSEPAERQDLESGTSAGLQRHGPCGFMSGLRQGKPPMFGQLKRSRWSSTLRNRSRSEHGQLLPVVRVFRRPRFPRHGPGWSSGTGRRGHSASLISTVVNAARIASGSRLKSSTVACITCVDLSAAAG